MAGKGEELRIKKTQTLTTVSKKVSSTKCSIFNDFYQIIWHWWMLTSFSYLSRSALTDFTNIVTRIFAVLKKLTCIAYFAVEVHEIFFILVALYGQMYVLIQAIREWLSSLNWLSCIPFGCGNITGSPKPLLHLIQTGTAKLSSRRLAVLSLQSISTSPITNSSLLF